MLEQYLGLNGYLGSTDRAVLLANGTGGLTAQASSLTLSANNCLTIPGSTLTASEPLLNLSQIWNNAGVAFTGIKFNATDTASASGSLLADFQVGGSSKFSVRKDGLVFSQSAIRGTDINATSSIGELSINFDTIITRDAANTLALRNGVNAQAFNIYNTWGNSGTDYERLSLYWSSNIGYLTTGKGGTGAGRHLRLDTSASGDLYLGTAGTLRYFISGNTGVFTPAVANTYDLGNSSLTFARGHFGTSVVSPKFVATSPQTYAATNVTTDRTYDANATTVDELADIVGTLISDLRTLGLVA